VVLFVNVHLSIKNASLLNLIWLTLFFLQVSIGFVLAVSLPIVFVIILASVIVVVMRRFHRKRMNKLLGETTIVSMKGAHRRTIFSLNKHNVEELCPQLT